MGESSGGDIQPYKYNGKELDRMHGLDWYDYGARHYDAAIVSWPTMDPLSEKYNPTSTMANVLTAPTAWIGMTTVPVTSMPPSVVGPRWIRWLRSIIASVRMRIVGGIR